MKTTNQILQLRENIKRSFSAIKLITLIFGMMMFIAQKGYASRVEVEFMGDSCPSIAYNPQINVSANENCQGVFTPHDITGTDTFLNTVFYVSFMELNGRSISGYNTTVKGTEEIFTPKGYHGKTIAVVLRYQKCSAGVMSRVQIEDKSRPRVTCVNDTIVQKYPGVPFTALATDNCTPVTITKKLDSTNMMYCDPDFLRIYTWTVSATDAYGRTSDECTHSIYISKAPTDSIKAPTSIQLSCSATSVNDGNGNPHPSVTGYPTYCGIAINGLNLQPTGLTATYKDETFQTNCKKGVLRKWTVIENTMCISDAEQVWTFTQLIDVIDTTKPTFSFPGQYWYYSANNSDCSATINLPAIYPADNCSKTFTFEIVYQGVSHYDWNGAMVTINQDTNVLIYHVSDGCGNVKTDTAYLIVKDNSGPVMNCKPAIHISLGNKDALELDARPFVKNINDYCGSSNYEVRRSVDYCGRADNTNYSDYITFCCKDVGKNLSVYVIAYDDLGNYSECIVPVDIQDKNNTCPRSATEQQVEAAELNLIESQQNLLGKINYLHNNDPIEGAIVDLLGESKTKTTNETGNFSFMTKMDKASKLKVSHSKTEPNVTNLDLLRIQQHILNQKTFSHPLEYMAADVNQDKTVDIYDLFALKKFLLGYGHENTSILQWDFVNTQEVWIDKYNPWANNIEMIHITPSSSERLNVELLGVIIGDVAQPENYHKRKLTTQKNESFAIEVVRNEEFTVLKFFATERTLLAGLDLKIDWQNEVEWEDGQIVMDQNGGTSFKDGKNYILWSNPNLRYVTPHKELFTIKLKGTNDNLLSKITEAHLQTFDYERTLNFRLRE